MQCGRSSEGVKVRFFGYGPGRFFAVDETVGRGRFLSLPSTFDDDKQGVFPAAEAPLPDCDASSIRPSVDNGVVKVDNIGGDFLGDSNMGEKEVRGRVDTSGWFVGWVLFAGNISSVYCAILLV